MTIQDFKNLGDLTREELCEEVGRLEALVEMTKLINSSISADALYSSISQIVREYLHVERCTLFFLEERTSELRATVSEEKVSEIRLPLGKGLAGSVAATGESVIVPDAYADSRFNQSIDRASGFRTRSILCAPVRNRDGRIVGVLQLLNKQTGPFGELDLRFLESLSHHLAIAMENYMLHVDLIEKERMESELELGREIQAQLLSPPPSNLLSTEIFVQFTPCYEVAGDYYDFVPLSSGELAIAVGDVSGKGVSAAIIMSSVQSGFRIAAPSASEFTELLERINRSLFQSARGKKYLTLFVARYSPESGLLRYVNAGHCSGIVTRSGGGVEFLTSTGQPIGLFPNVTLGEKSVVIGPGDTLVLYTDGFVEAERGEDDELGMDRFVAMVQASAPLVLGEMASMITREVTGFESGTPQSDDKTLVLLRRKPTQSG